MDEDLCQTLSRACDDCHLAGGCCFEARPPLSQKRIEILMENGISADAIEFVGYKRLCLGPDGFCVLFRDGKCSIHDIKNPRLISEAVTTSPAPVAKTVSEPWLATAVCSSAAVSVCAVACEAVVAR